MLHRRDTARVVIILMGWYTINYAVGSVLSLLLGLFVLFRGEARDLTRKTWFLLCVSVSVWHAGHFLMEIARTTSVAQTAVYPIYIGAILISPIYLHFILSLLEEEKNHPFLLVACYFFALVELILLFGGRLIEGVKLYPHGGFYEVPARIYWIYIANYVLVPGIAITKLIIAHRRTDAVVKANQYEYVIYSSLIGFFCGAMSFFPFFTSLIPPVGAPVVYFYTLPISYAVARYRLMDIDVVIQKSLVYTLLLMTLLVPCYLLVLWGQKLAFGTVNYNFSMATLLILVIVGFLFPKFRFRTEEAVERVLFRKRYDYRTRLLHSSRDLFSMVDLETLSEKLVQTVSRELGTNKASLFLSDDDKGALTQRASVGLGEDRFKNYAIRKDDPFVLGLVKRREALIQEELQMDQEGPESLQLAEKMEEMEAEVTLPLLSKNRLIGILNLGHKEDKELYSTEDLDVLFALANQAAVAIENAQLYENLKLSQTIIQRNDRLSSLGLLTAGLAHEIRNPLVAIRTFTQLLPERYADPEFRDTFKSLALKEVDRICGLVNDLLSFARPSTPRVSPEDVNEIVDNIARLLETEAKEKDVRIHLRPAVGLPKIFIDKEQIKQVLMNVILNAIQSIEGRGSIDICTRLFSREGGERFVQIEVRDTGVGIEESDLENIFNPFFTTKKEGSGLGLSISHQIIQEHGGHMVAESKPGEGTAFFINLPAKLSTRAVSESPETHEKDLGH